MIYGPYKRQSKLQPFKTVQRAKHHNYKARPGKPVLCLRAAFAVCVAALLGFGGRMLYLKYAARGVSAPYVTTAWELLLMTVLTISALLLLYLLERNGRRK